MPGPKRQARQYDEESSDDSREVRPEVKCVSLFFDDVRTEAGGKMTMIGHYPQDTCLLADHTRLDRLSVYTRLSWGWKIRPKRLFLQLKLPGREVEQQPIPFAQPEQPPFSDVDKFVAQSVVHLRFSPMRPGDMIQVWVRFDDFKLPTGHLIFKSTV